MKYYRMNNPNWDGKSPDRQFSLAIVVTHDGEDHFMRIQTHGGVRFLELEPVSKHVMVPSAYLLDQDAFHRARSYYECFCISAMTEVTEEQIKAEETIDINSGFGWLNHDRKESNRQQGGLNHVNPTSPDRISGGVSKLGTGGGVNQVGTFRSIDPTLSVPHKSGKTVTEEELKLAQQMFDRQLRQNLFDKEITPSFNVEPDGKVTIKAGEGTIVLNPGDKPNATK